MGDLQGLQECSGVGRELIEEIESEYHKIRKRVRHLVIALKEVKKYAKCLIAQGEDLGDEE